MWKRRLLALVASFVIPPAALFLIRGSALISYVSAVFFVVALCVFFLIAALPGLILWLLSIAFAFIISLFGRSAEVRQVSSQ
jgi:hypothetical protein